VTSQSFWKRLLAHKLRYIAANILVSGLGFGRNVLFMKTLGLADLGQVALMQTIVMMIGFFQFGLINGAYRIYAAGEREQNEEINNSLFTFFLLLAMLALVLAVFCAFAAGGGAVHPETLMIGVTAGVATLVSTWVNNALIADGHLGRSNLINLTAVALSLVVGVMSHTLGLPAALLSMLVQPLCVPLLAVFVHRRLRPIRLQLRLTMVRRILELGFIPFLAGLFALLNQQVERWAITYVIGPEALGRFYVVMLYATFFVLVPVSLLSLYFPRTVRAFEAGRREEFVGLVKRHFAELTAYISAALLVTFLLLSWVLANYFDKYKGAESLVYLVIPGLVAQVLCDPASLVFNSVKRLRPLLIYGALGLLLNSTLLFLVYELNMFSLEAVAAVRSISNATAFTYLFLTLMMYRKKYIRPVAAS
jgi:O-antigen/teichoic acid export membrane protein